MGHSTMPEPAMEAILRTLETANRRAAGRYPGEPDRRQPVHTVYGGAHLFTADAVAKLGRLALTALREFAPDPRSLTDALDVDRALADRIYTRVVEKLEREPIEDFRIDFEDGFGNRGDEEEDRYARETAGQVARGMTAGSLPPAIGIRIKPLNEELKRRSLRTFDLFLTSLLDETGGRLPDQFVLTLPKITVPEQVAALAASCDAFERQRGLPAGTLRFELMIETPQSVFAADGTVALPVLVSQGQGRIVAAHFGTYDYTAACGITAAHQHMLHPACNFAKNVMQVALAGTGIWLSDGATNVLPVAPHRPGPGSPLTAAQHDENRRVVRRAWQLHAQHVRHSLVTGFYQGWDLHPAQLVSRYGALYAFFLEGLDPASARLRNFLEKAAQATIVGEVFDDAATGQGLLNFFLRAMNCGAITEEEAVARTGLKVDELRSRSFAAIVQTASRANAARQP